jgi:alpha-D-ribose 1-methylphosphonate 5-triphosphate diphosphatase PhnM
MTHVFYCSQHGEVQVVNVNNCQRKCELTKRVIKSLISRQDRHYNGQQKKSKKNWQLSRKNKNVDIKVSSHDAFLE